MSNTVLQYALEDDLKTRREKSMCISLGDKQADCLSNLRFADDVLLFSTSLKQLKNMMMSEFKRSTESVRLKTHPEKTKILCNQKIQPSSGSNSRRYQSRAIIIKRESEVPGPNHFVRATRNDGNKEQNPRCLGIICKITNNVKIVSPSTSTTFLQLGRRTHDDVRFWHLDVNA